MVHYELEESINGCGGEGGESGYAFASSFNARVSRSYIQNNWAHIAETTMPLKQSKFGSDGGGSASFQASVEYRSKQLSAKLVVVNVVSMLINLTLAIVAFYFSFTRDSTSTSAFAADCILDFISGAIVLWRYYGELNSVYAQAREQIACIYLGCLFGISAIGIIVKATSDMLSGEDTSASVDTSASKELLWLAVVATVACCILTAYKCALYKILRDKSILLDVINTLISTVFAMSLIMSQALIGIDRKFWYLDPVLSILLALFMMGFGLKVICENMNILKPHLGHTNQTSPDNQDCSPLMQFDMHHSAQSGKSTKNGPVINRQYGTNLSSLVGELESQIQGKGATWQKSDYSSIVFSS